MTVTTVPTGHFKGGRALTQAPAVGSDVRSLDTILQQVIAQVNAGQSSVVIPIAAAADFPLLAAVIPGQIYRVTVGCTDNVALHTATGQVFVAGDEIIWNGTNWTLLGRSGRTFSPAIDLQAVAADATTTSFIAPAAGTILGVYAKSGATAAAAESMTFDVKIAGVTCLTAPISIAAAQTTVAQAGTLAAAVSFTAGQVITIVRDYTAGGGPTPMVNTLVSIFAELS